MTTERPDFYLGTAIDGPHLASEQLFVRSKNLNELIGDFTFTEALFHVLQARRPTAQETKLLDIVLVAFHAGFGILPPTTLVPRFVVGTGGSIPQALAAGYLASGPYHVGAVEQAMRFYLEILERFRDQPESGSSMTAVGLEAFAFEQTRAVINRKETIPGYGHPLLRRDPRPVRIRRAVGDAGAESPFLDIYDGVARCAEELKGIPPNVDGVTGAILLTLGFQPRHGTAFFLLARTAAMIAHALEEVTEMPYQTQKRFMLLPVVMPKLFNADFNRLNKLFNRLRDNRAFRSLQGLFGRQAKQQYARQRTEDLEAIAAHAAARREKPIAEELDRFTVAPEPVDEFVAAAEKLDAARRESSEADPERIDVDEQSSPEVLAAAAVCLASSLQRKEGISQVAQARELLQAALELVDETAVSGDR